MKRAAFATAGLVASTLVVSSLVGPISPAHAGPCDAPHDMQSPTYVSSSVSPSSIVIGKTKRTLTITVRATDNCAVTAVDVTMTPRVHPSAGTIWWTGLKRTSGTATNGTWTVTRQVSPYLPGGVWDLSQLNIDDSGGRETTTLNAHGTTHIRHSTSTKLIRPKSKVDKGKKVTIAGAMTIDGDYHRSQVDVQSRVPGHKWKKIGTVKTDVFGNYSAKYEVTKTKDYRVVHNQGNTTTASTSKTYRVKKS